MRCLERRDERFVERLFDDRRLARALARASAARAGSLVLGSVFGVLFALQPWLNPERDALRAAAVLLGLVSCAAGHLHATQELRLMRFARRLRQARPGTRAG